MVYLKSRISMYTTIKLSCHLIKIHITFRQTGTVFSKSYFSDGCIFLGSHIWFRIATWEQNFLGKKKMFEDFNRNCLSSFPPTRVGCRSTQPQIILILLHENKVPYAHPKSSFLQHLIWIVFTHLKKKSRGYNLWALNHLNILHW